MATSRRAQKWARQLGLDQFVRNFLDSGPKEAAELVRQELEIVLVGMQSKGNQRSLDGYSAIAYPAKGGTTTIVLPKSGLKLKGDFEWIVTVEANKHHQSLGLNVFNILDTGRRRLPKGRIYPLWGTPPRDQGFQGSVFRKEPREKGQKGAPGFTSGPIKAVEPLNLYEKARAKADAKLGGNKSLWAVIYIGDVDK